MKGKFCLNKGLRFHQTVITFANHLLSSPIHPLKMNSVPFYFNTNWHLISGLSQILLIQRFSYKKFFSLRRMGNFLFTHYFSDNTDSFRWFFRYYSTWAIYIQLNLVKGFFQVVTGLFWKNKHDTNNNIIKY